MLVLLARGHDHQRIAGELYVSEGTVKNHITNIYDKLEVHSRTEAGAWAWRHGLVDNVDGGKTSGSICSVLPLLKRNAYVTLIVGGRNIG